MPCWNSWELVAFTRLARSTSLACIFSRLLLFRYARVELGQSGRLSLFYARIFFWLTFGATENLHIHSVILPPVELLDAGGLSSLVIFYFTSTVFMLDTAWIWICIMTLGYFKAAFALGWVEGNIYPDDLGETKLTASLLGVSFCLSVAWERKGGYDGGQGIEIYRRIMYLGPIKSTLFLDLFFCLILWDLSQYVWRDKPLGACSNNF